ncbi:hypothetical protein JYU20_00650 [Bacteroidales bacterium AH-315-I05]|nr:hypothetical protein [Bacteroidales bacterium AH-315-I05]
MNSNDNHACGLLYGPSHEDVGIMAINNATQRLLNLEGGEFVVCRAALDDETEITLTGTPIQVVSQLNQRVGCRGVTWAYAINEDGNGEIMRQGGKTRKKDDFWDYYKPKTADDAFAFTMHDWKLGQLHDRAGDVVPYPYKQDQAVAIAFSRARKLDEHYEKWEKGGPVTAKKAWIELAYKDPEGIDWAKDRLLEDKIDRVFKKAGIKCRKNSCATGSGIGIAGEHAGIRDIIYEVSAEQQKKAVNAIKKAFDELSISRKDISVRSEIIHEMKQGGHVSGEIGRYKVAYMGESPDILKSRMFENEDMAIDYMKGKKKMLLFELQSAKGVDYRWKVLPYGDYKKYRLATNVMYIFRDGGEVESPDYRPRATRPRLVTTEYAIQKMADGGPIFSGSQVSRQIKKELTAAFPSIKFSVRYSSFAGGNSVDIGWNFGPTKEEVEAIANKYQYGHFEGMTDTYHYEKQSVITAKGDMQELGGVKYVVTSRDRVFDDGRSVYGQYNAEEDARTVIAKLLADIYGVNWDGRDFTKADKSDRETLYDKTQGILYHNSFSTDKVQEFNELVKTGVTSGVGLSDFYKIKYNDNKVTKNASAEENLEREKEYERSRPQREAEEKAKSRARQEKAEELEFRIGRLRHRTFQLIEAVKLTDVEFPSINGNDTLDEYRTYLEEDRKEKKDIKARVQIDQIIIVNQYDWETLTNSFLQNLPRIWNGVGGTGIDYDIAKKYNFPEELSSISQLTKEQTEIWFANNFLIGTLLYNETANEAIVIDTQNYGYARYVGFPSHKSEIEKALLNIKIPQEIPEKKPAPSPFVDDTFFKKHPEKVVKDISEIETGEFEPVKKQPAKADYDKLIAGFEIASKYAKTDAQKANYAKLITGFGIAKKYLKAA